MNEETRAIACLVDAIVDWRDYCKNNEPQFPIEGCPEKTRQQMLMDAERALEQVSGILGEDWREYVGLNWGIDE